MHRQTDVALREKAGVQDSTGIGQGIAISKAVEGVARNPGASGKIMTIMLIGLAMIESLGIYVFVVAMIILFANPFTETVLQIVG